MLNDLLDPARANLKLREDPAKGFFVENIKEETLVSVEHALSVIAAGDAHRKVALEPSTCCCMILEYSAYAIKIAVWEEAKQKTTFHARKRHSWSCQELAK